MGMGATWRRWVKLGILLVGLGGVVALLPHLGVRWSELSPDQVRSYVLSFGWWAPAAYFLLYAQPIVPLPISIVCMAGGVAFGLVGGIALSLVASTVRGCGQFLIAKTFGREAVESLLKGRWAALDASIGRNAFWTVVWVRIVPNVPFDLQNYSLGCSRVPFKAFAVATFVGLIPGISLWVWAGHTLTDLSQLWKVVAVLLVFAGVWGLQHRYRARRPAHPAALPGAAAPRCRAPS